MATAQKVGLAEASGLGIEPSPRTDILTPNSESVGLTSIMDGSFSWLLSASPPPCPGTGSCTHLRG